MARKNREALLIDYVLAHLYKHFIERLLNVWHYWLLSIWFDRSNRFFSPYSKISTTWKTTPWWIFTKKKNAQSSNNSIRFVPSVRFINKKCSSKINTLLLDHGTTQYTLKGL